MKDPVPSMSLIDLNLKNTSVFIHSEIAEQSLKKKLGEEYCCWCILRTLVRKFGKGNGRISVETAVQAISEILEMSERSVRRRIKNGERTFWRVGEKSLYLIGIMKVVVQLDLDCVVADKFVVPLSLFSGGVGERRTLLLSTVASRDTGSPVSVQNLAERCGISPRSVKRLLSPSMFCEREVNYEDLGEVSNPVMVREKIRNDRSLSLHKMRAGKLRLMRRLPNSWLTKLDRKPLYEERRRFFKVLGESGATRSRIYRRKIDEVGGVVEMGWAELGSSLSSRINGPKVRVWSQNE